MLEAVSLHESEKQRSHHKDNDAQGPSFEVVRAFFPNRLHRDPSNRSQDQNDSVENEKEDKLLVLA